MAAVSPIKCILAAGILLAPLAPCRADPAPVIHYAPAENLEYVDVALIDGMKSTLRPMS
jgi:hypothetical protein